VRYLRQGNVSLVLEALHERGILLQNAPHLVSNQAFVVPVYDWWDGPFYGVGLKVYDMLAGKLGFGRSKNISRRETLRRIPTLQPKGLCGGVIYYDGQFDDARLAVNLAQTAADQGAAVLNYVRVTDLCKAGGTLNGALIRDMESGREHRVYARAVVNATGVFTDEILEMDEPGHERLIRPSQGVHLVLDKRFLPSNTAIMVPRMEDGRVLFAVPWHDKVVVGTTDTPVAEVCLEPKPLDFEVDSILECAACYLADRPEKKDVLRVFAGLRPLVDQSGRGSTASVSRDHHLVVSASGLVTITGGKWTTYRRMAQETVRSAALVAGLDERPCRTKELRIHGWLKNADFSDHLHVYGTDAPGVMELAARDKSLSEKLHPGLPYLRAEVVWAARHEMARTVEDVLARRTRALILDARAAVQAADDAAMLLARELRRDQTWAEDQSARFKELAEDYVLNSGQDHQECAAADRDDP
jgi:glycerol-3-phosphate dehydrogenase